MPTAFAFRLSIYLTLVLSSVSLGYSEWDYLPEVTVFTAVTVLAMGAAFVMDNRGRHLSFRQANAVGVIIFVLAGTWVGYHYGRADSLMHTLPWPAGGLPYLGPMLMLLLAAKLFRPKHTGDWWALYGISLACVGLAIALAEDGIFVALVLLYAAMAVWSLTLFYLRRTAASDARIPLSPYASGRTQLWPAMCWMGLASLVAIPIFFLTPRTAGLQWELFQTRLESGMPIDGSPDLGRTGQLKPNPEVAFEVSARTLDGQPKLDLPFDQRWRGPSFTEYQSPRGRWARRDRAAVSRIIAVAGNDFSRPTESVEWPDLGPNAYELEFRLISRTGGPIFADPVAFKPGERPPIVVPLRSGFGYAWQNWDTSFVFLQREFRFANRYRQLTRGRDDRGREPVSTFRLTEPNDPELLAPFLTPPPPGIGDYARRLLARCLNEGTLPRAVQQRVNAFGALHPDDYATVAEAFRLHLGFTGGFAYTLDLRRQDRSLDPVEDFLLNTRSGHCERFASALVLLLRGVDIPAQLVLGYRGQEPQGDGTYVVRQENAHAWAEVLLPTTVRGGREWHWQAFDATPTVTAGDFEDNTGVIESSAKQGQRLFAEFVIGLNPDSQRRLTAGVSEFFSEYWPYLATGMLALAGTLLALRRLFRWELTSRAGRSGSDPVPWYTRLVVALQHAGLPLIAGETPREFARRAGEWLKSKPAISAFADVPREASEMVYALRFAERTPDRGELEALIAAIDRIPR